MKFKRTKLQRAVMEMYRWSNCTSMDHFVDTHVLLVGDGSKLALVKHAMEQKATLIGTVEGEGEPFVGLIDARFLRLALGPIQNTVVSLTQKEEHVLLSSPSGAVVMESMPIDEFPTEYWKPEEGWKDIGWVRTEQFHDAVRYASLAMSPDYVRPHLNGVLLDKDEVVGTDGHRMHQVECETAIKNFVMPALAVNTIVRQFKSARGLTHIERKGRRVRFTCKTWELTMGKRDIRFPPYNKIIPSHSERVAVLDSEPLYFAALHASKYHYDTFAMTLNGSLKVKASNREGLEMEPMEFDLIKPVDHEVTIGVRSQYLADALENRSDVARLKVNGPSDAVLIPSKNKLAVIMPVRL
jgi:DNA polymerase-3 subunit beta